jgi:predicted permease
MLSVIRDIRYGCRSLIKRPGFSLIAVFTIALGIGANTAILSTVNGFILRPLPVPHSDQIFQLFWGGNKDAEVWNNFSYPNYVDLRDQNKTLTGLLAWTMAPAAIGDLPGRSTRGEEGHSDIIWGECVSGNYFDVLGVKPVIGRTFLPEEDATPDTHPVVVISHALWERRFNSEPATVGKTTYLNGHPFVVIGVTPSEYQGAKFGIRQDFWVPLMMSGSLGALGTSWQTERGWQILNLLGRLKPGTSREQAEADLDRIERNLASLYPATNADSKLQLVPELEGRFGDIGGLLKFTSVIALSVAGLVLLVACANVANLLLARAASRTREIGIRLAIGAGRLQIVRQLLVESLLLSLMGAALGLLFAFWGADLVHASIPPLPYPIKLDFTPDLLVLKWMFAISLATGLIFGLLPSIIASRTNLVAVLKGDVSGGSEHSAGRRFSVRNLLVVAQVAISIVVLVCAGLFLRSLTKARNADPGFATDNLLTVRVSPGLLNYTPAEGKRFFSDLIARVKDKPGVREVSAALFTPLGDSNTNRGPIVREGDPAPLPNQGVRIDANVVSPKYFETMHSTLLMGREFTEHDDENSPPVAIVNQEFARRIFGSEENALGKRFWRSGPNSKLLEIVGIAKDARYLSLYENQRPYFFMPENQEYESDMTLLVSCSGPSEMRVMADNIRAEVALIDPRVPVYGMQVGERNLAYAYWGPRLAAGLASAFGLLALLLAVMGLYSVMAYSVSRRTREIGIRMALGAQVGDVLKMVVGEGMGLVLSGIVIGMIGALALTRVLTSLLFGVGAGDLLTYLGVGLLLTIVALAACYVPARRAARVRPMTALRYE